MTSTIKVRIKFKYFVIIKLKIRHSIAKPMVNECLNDSSYGKLSLNITGGCLPWVAPFASTPYLRAMNGTKTDIDPTTELIEEDEDQALPEPETAIDLAAGAGPLAIGQLALGRAVIANYAAH